MVLPAPGWMPDPSFIGVERYWDGSRWTSRTRDAHSHVETTPTPTANRSWVVQSKQRRRWDVSRAFGMAMVVAAASGACVWGYSFIRPVSIDNGTQAAGGNVFARPSDPDVAYPAYGSDEFVQYLEKSMVEQDATIDVAYWTARGVSADDVTDAMQEAMSQNPYIYAGGWTMSGPGTVARVEPDYTYPDQEAQRRREATATAVEVGLASVRIDTIQGDKEKAAAIYDYVTSAATYDYSAYDAITAGDINGYEESQEAYGILVSGTAVCNGYAKAYLAMAERAGLDTVIVTGDVVQGMTIGSHAWDKVRIDGTWLTVDPTWDDNDADDNRSGRDYFLLPDGDAAAGDFATA